MVSALDFSQVKEQNLFPTQVFIFQVPSEPAQHLNASLLNLIYAERERDIDGLKRSNHPALGGWHSQNFLHKQPEYAEIVEVINSVGAEIGKTNNYSESHHLKIGTMWSIINGPGSYNQSHVHPKCLWSGVYYVKTPENCGNISFTDPRIAHVMRPAVFSAQGARPKSCWTKVNYTPKPGKMLVFPSWLYHAVAPNLSTGETGETDRVIISFNLNQSPVSADPVE